MGAVAVDVAVDHVVSVGLVVVDAVLRQALVASVLGVAAPGAGGVLVVDDEPVARLAHHGVDDLLPELQPGFGDGL